MLTDDEIEARLREIRAFLTDPSTPHDKAWDHIAWMWIYADHLQRYIDAAHEAKGHGC